MPFARPKHDVTSVAEGGDMTTSKVEPRIDRRRVEPSVDGATCDCSITSMGSQMTWGEAVQLTGTLSSRAVGNTPRIHRPSPIECRGAGR